MHRFYQNQIHFHNHSDYNSFTGAVSGTAVENILHRDFSTTAINQKWTTDVTEFKVCGKRNCLDNAVSLF
ncbi:MAG: hypothetical protein MR739_08285 [Spirochaetia bacterium]|nr:hypothetical protein [Spirochaetia bacterium]